MRERQGTRPEDVGRARCSRGASLSLSGSPSLSSSDSSNTPPPRSHDLWSRRHRHRSPSLSSSSSYTLSASSTRTPAIDTFVPDLWARTWNLVAESMSLTPVGAPRSRNITRAQLIMLIHDANPLEDEFENAMVDHLVIGARKVVMKHRRNAQYDDRAELRNEREDVRLAVRYSV
ncbi:nudix family hydrolase [Alternaria alternata]|nr:nudix family hydrolase [Alternaria alternata]